MKVPFLSETLDLTGRHALKSETFASPLPLWGPELLEALSPQEELWLTPIFRSLLILLSLWKWLEMPPSGSKRNYLFDLAAAAFDSKSAARFHFITTLSGVFPPLQP